jgi:Domain of unknown function (DUF4384)
MSGKMMKRLLRVSVLALASLGLVLVAGARAQDPSREDERRLWDSEFLKKRTASKTAPAARSRSGYRRITSKIPPAESKPVEERAEGEMIGVTIWRLRPSKQGDGQEARLLIEEDGGKQKAEMTLERVESETIFSPGDQVRLAIESSRDGYLYVIDRELYADGTSSDPYLIFPTLKNRNGDNSVRAGKVSELPEGSVFTLKPKRKDYAGEKLTVIITPQPLKEVSAGPREVKLDGALVEGWEKQWSAASEKFELNSGAGKLYTKSEKEAGGESARLLTQEDELPQTLYRIVAGQGNPLLITVPLRIK